MKSSLLSKAFGFLFCVSALVFLTSFFKVHTPGNSSATLSDAELSGLVDNAVKDPIFASITESDVKRVLGKLTFKEPITQEQWNELAKKGNFSESETELIFSTLGFLSVRDFTDYANLLTALGKKYGIYELRESDQKRFFSFLQKRQDEYISSNSLLEKAWKQQAFTGGMPPECWKCVYDYRDCLGGGGSWVISYTPVTSTTTRYDMSNGGISITRITYTSPSRPEIDYINPYYSTASCEGIYRNCMNSCATP